MCMLCVFTTVSCKHYSSLVHYPNQTQFEVISWSKAWLIHSALRLCYLKTFHFRIQSQPHSHIHSAWYIILIHIPTVSPFLNRTIYRASYPTWSVPWCSRKYIVVSCFILSYWLLGLWLASQSSCSRCCRRSVSLIIRPAHFPHPVESQNCTPCLSSGIGQPLSLLLKVSFCRFENGTLSHYFDWHINSRTRFSKTLTSLSCLSSMWSLSSRVWRWMWGWRHHPDHHLTTYWSHLPFAYLLTPRSLTSTLPAWWLATPRMTRAFRRLWKAPI